MRTAPVQREIRIGTQAVGALAAVSRVHQLEAAVKTG